MTSTATRYGSFLIRIWSEDEQTVRILVEDTLTGKQYRFASYLALVGFVAGELRQLMQSAEET